MATLDDKLLGEKLHYYCSSSEDEGDDGEGDEGVEAAGKSEKKAQFIPEEKVAEYEEGRKWRGTASNTGPKGVIEDWRKYKQLENEKREDKEAERLELLKKLSLTCRSELDEEREKEARAKQQQAEDDWDKMLLDDDEFLAQYRLKRMQEMVHNLHELPKFGHIRDLLSTQQFLDAVDKEHKQVTVVVLIYEEDIGACVAMNGCIQCLAVEYVNVKFCRMKASTTNLSKKFLRKGIPALITYRGGELIGSFVQLQSVFGDDFFATDVESYLVEHGILPDKTCVPSIIRSGANDDDDSDLDLD